MWKHPTGKSPKNVIIVALGPSNHDYISAMLATGYDLDFDEMWTVNHGMRLFIHDLAFDMHDYRYMGDHKSRQMKYHKKMVRETKKPVIMVEPYPDIKKCFKYPLQFVMDSVGPENTYFNNTVPYMLAYAYAIGVKEIGLFGADYHYPGIPKEESGKSCCEFWVGFLRARGVQVRICAGSTLTDANANRPLYGYLFTPEIKVESVKGKVIVPTVKA